MVQQTSPVVQHPVTRSTRIINGLVSLFLRLGVGPANTYRLTVTGRRSGRPHTVPVTLVDYDGRRYLVAPRGEVSWARNLRVCGRAMLTRGGHREAIVASEVPAAHRPPILKQYVTVVPITRRYLQTPFDAPVAAFAAEAATRPIFLVEPASDGYQG